MTHRHHVDDALGTRRPTLAEANPLFGSVICVVYRGSTGHVAHEQAAALGAGGDVEYIVTPRPAEGTGALLDRCDGADLLVLGAGDDADSVLRRASLPLLLARWCPPGTRVTDRILIAIDDDSEPDRAAEAAALLASRYGGTVAVVSAPAPNRMLERATAATSRIVLRSAGLVPHVYGRGAPMERAILSAAASMDASLLVLPLGGTEHARNQAISIARFVACSVLTIPVPTAVPRACERPAGADAHRDVIGIG
jgi:hypothetical protein